MRSKIGFSADVLPTDLDELCQGSVVARNTLVVQFEPDRCTLGVGSRPIKRKRLRFL